MHPAKNGFRIAALLIAGVALASCGRPAPVPPNGDSPASPPPAASGPEPTLTVTEIRAGFGWQPGHTEVVRARARADTAAIVLDAQLPLPVSCLQIRGGLDRIRPDTLTVRLDAVMPEAPPGREVGCPQVAGTRHVRAMVRPAPRGRSSVRLRYVVPRAAGPPQIDTTVLLGTVAVP